MKIEIESRAWNVPNVKGIARGPDVIVGVRMKPDLLEMLKALAWEGRRSVSGQIRHMIKEGMMPR
jgi:hypothetical protein